MKKKKKLSNALQYAVTVFLALAMMGAFMFSFGSGFFMLLATLLACPFTRNAGINFAQKRFGDKVPIDKIKGGVYAVVAIVFIFIASALSPTTETIDNNQVAQIEAESVQNELLTAKNIESTEVLKETAEGAVVASEETQESVELTVSNMEVHFIDVGQGDATLIKADGQYMLIDAGDNDKGTAVQLYLQKQGVEKLDYLVLTHTDADHIGGADVIVTKFDVDTVFLGDFEKDNKTYEELMDALEYKGLNYSTPEVGNEYEIGNATFKIVAPNKTYSDPNNNSIALVLENGDDAFLFTGDCEEEAENDILTNGLKIDCDVYKLGHHGSSSSSGKAFLEAVSPTYGVISCEEGNAYGHPHAETLNNLRSMGVLVFRTDEQGSIVAYSDGTEITWNCAPSETWQVGEVTATPTPTPMATPIPTAAPTSEPNYVIANKNTGAFHRPTCSRLPKEKNRVIFNSREEALAAGYDNPCDYCNP